MVGWCIERRWRVFIKLTEVHHDKDKLPIYVNISQLTTVREAFIETDKAKGINSYVTIRDHEEALDVAESVDTIMMAISRVINDLAWKLAQT